ncbi:hypothetical protein GUJ93_ZPchr0010g10545 [Zizania palustris]|uniref:Uncharacterized protein n=1 Tax=Zizania palustris TaxID=103762 RepID=A0A8J5WH82_ZIZPA|nr:hypothetical protein GUJ93_ZPchr0010g10545 [Zizania palustris]
MWTTKALRGDDMGSGGSATAGGGPRDTQPCPHDAPLHLRDTHVIHNHAHTTRSRAYTAHRFAPPTAAPPLLAFM